MVEAIEATQCYEIAEEVLKEVTDHVDEQNKNTLEKTLTISMQAFSKGFVIKSLRLDETFKKLPAGEPMKMKVGPTFIEIPGVNLLKISNERRIKDISLWVEKLEMPFDKLEFCVTLLVDSNKVFKENKSFDQFRIVTKEAA